MDFPGDETMLLLLAIQTGEPLAPHGDGLAMTLPHRADGEEVVEGVDADLDALEARGWVSVETDQPTLTEQGRYALGLWFKRRRKVRIDVNTLRMGVFK